MEGGMEFVSIALSIAFEVTGEAVVTGVILLDPRLDSVFEMLDVLLTSFLLEFEMVPEIIKFDCDCEECKDDNKLLS